MERSHEALGSDDGSESDDDSTDDDDDDDDDDDTEAIDFTGMKCRAPYTHSWGEMSFHNAVILSVLSDQSQVCFLATIFVCILDRSPVGGVTRTAVSLNIVEGEFYGPARCPAASFKPGIERVQACTR